MTHKEFLESLGTTGELAQILGVSSPLVSKWKVRSIPWPRRPKLIKLAKKMGVPLPENFMEL